MEAEILLPAVSFPPSRPSIYDVISTADHVRHRGLKWLPRRPSVAIVEAGGAESKVQEPKAENEREEGGVIGATPRGPRHSLLESAYPASGLKEPRGGVSPPRGRRLASARTARSRAGIQ